MMKDRLDQADNDAKTAVEKYVKLLEAKNVSNTGCKEIEIALLLLNLH